MHELPELRVIAIEESHLVIGVNRHARPPM